MSARADHPGLGDFLDGAKAAVAPVVAAMPFGLLFGALAFSNGLSVFEAVLMSATIFGGASQMVGIDLFGQRIAPWLVVLAIFAVNFRHVLYSAAIGSKLDRMSPAQGAAAFFFLTDVQYAEAEKRHERGRRITPAWYAGLALPIYGAWVAETWIGAVFGGLIDDPAALGLDFLLTIYFLGMVLEFRMRAGWLPTVAASAAGSIAAFWTIGSPWHVTVGGICGVAMAAAIAPALSSAPRDHRRS